MKFIKLKNCNIYSMFFGSAVLAVAIFGNGRWFDEQQVCKDAMVAKSLCSHTQSTSGCCINKFNLDA